VYGWDTLVLLKHYVESGLSKTAIARQLGVSRRVIYHWITTGQLDREVSGTAPARCRASRGTKLARYQPLIEERLATYPALSAVRLLEECRAAGYAGGYSQLKAYVARVRPRPEPEPIVRFETAPGQQAPFDFAEIRFPWGKRFALLVMLGYSRVLYVEFVARQTALTVMLGLERAFAAFGGVPPEILFDQMTSVIVEDHRPTGGRLVENPEFLRFATPWAMRAVAASGRLDAAVSTVMGHFAALWTPDNQWETAATLAAAYGVRVAVLFTPKNLPPGVRRVRGLGAAIGLCHWASCHNSQRNGGSSADRLFDRPGNTSPIEPRAIARASEGTRLSKSHLRARPTRRIPREDGQRTAGVGDSSKANLPSSSQSVPTARALGRGGREGEPGFDAARST
jgi:transposase